jgi:hypothetical protein
MNRWFLKVLRYKRNCIYFRQLLLGCFNSSHFFFIYHVDKLKARMKIVFLSLIIFLFGILHESVESKPCCGSGKTEERLKFLETKIAALVKSNLQSGEIMLNARIYKKDVEQNISLAQMANPGVLFQLIGIHVYLQVPEMNIEVRWDGASHIFLT